MLSRDHSKSRRKPRGQGKPTPRPEGERLQKVLAAAGIASRRQCEQLILEGRIEVDRQVVTELGTRVDVSKHEVRADGEPILCPQRVWFAVNKPPGIVCTNRDPAGRARVIDLIDANQRLFTVGRLDRSSEGLILVTNDGELANRLAHPRYELERTYQVVVAGTPSTDRLNLLRRGVHLAEGRVRVARLRVKRRQTSSTVLEMVLTEGRNREIRRMAARIGHKVMSLKRIAFGPVRLGDLPTGQYRSLTSNELRTLRALLVRQTHGSGPAPTRGPTHHQEVGVAGGRRRARRPSGKPRPAPKERRRKKPAGKRR